MTKEHLCDAAPHHLDGAAGLQIHEGKLNVKEGVF
jgi:hypothetical protein